MDKGDDRWIATHSEDVIVLPQWIVSGLRRRILGQAEAVLGAVKEEYAGVECVKGLLT